LKREKRLNTFLFFPCGIGSVYGIVEQMTSFFFFFLRIVMAGDCQWVNFWRSVSRKLLACGRPSVAGLLIIGLLTRLAALPVIVDRFGMLWPLLPLTALLSGLSMQAADSSYV
jgi:hypothetical protein